jgi:hypothetical protein
MPSSEFRSYTQSMHFTHTTRSQRLGLPVRSVLQQTRLCFWLPVNLLPLDRHIYERLLNRATVARRPGIQFPAGARDFSPLHAVHSGSGAHPASYPMGTVGSLSPGVK